MADSCPACRRPVRVTLTRGGLRLLLDPEPSDEGTVVIERLGDGAIRGRVLTGDSPEAPGDTVVAYTQHRHTCAHSKDAKRRKAAATPRCIDCGERLHPLLVAIARPWHWLCGPAPRPGGLVAVPDLPAEPEQLDLEEATA